MLYKEYQDLKLSMLGFGTMRLPLKGENPDSIDEEKTAKMFEYALSVDAQFPLRVLAYLSQENQTSTDP